MIDESLSLILRDIIDQIFISKELKSSTSKTDTYVLRSNACREINKDQFKDALSVANIAYVEEYKGSSIEAIIIKDVKRYVFLFKNVRGSGGVSDSTMNSIITEIIPSIFIMYPLLTSIDDILLNWDSIDIFVNQKDKDYAKSIIKSFINSSKYELKMKQSLGIVSYIKSNHQNIKSILWIAKSKPVFVSKNNHSDILLTLSDNSLLGISIKTGTSSSREPQFNTTVKQIKKFFDNYSVEELSKDIFSLYNIPNITFQDYISKSDNFVSTLLNYKETNPEDYDKIYNSVLKHTKESISRDFLNTSKMKEFVSNKILKNSNDNIPIVIIKAVGDSYKEISNDKINNVFTYIEDIECSYSKTNKQILEVKLNKSGENDPILLFLIRTSNPKPMNKLQQAPNLKVIYIGLKE